MVVTRMMEWEDELQHFPREVGDLVQWTRSRIHPHESCELMSGNTDDVKVLHLTTIGGATRREIVWTIQDQSHILPSFKGIGNKVTIKTPDNSGITLDVGQIRDSFGGIDGNNYPKAYIEVPTVGDVAGVMEVIKGPFGLNIEFLVPETVNQRELLIALANDQGDGERTFSPYHEDWSDHSDNSEDNDEEINIDAGPDDGVHLTSHYFNLVLNQRRISTFNIFNFNY